MEADTIFHNANYFQYNIDLLPVSSSMTGSGMIAGSIHYGSDSDDQKGQPAVNVEILLFDEFNQPLICCHSDINGEFCLENVTLDSYQVHAEVTGKYTYPVIVSLNNDNPEEGDIILTIGSSAVNGDVFGVEENDWSILSNPYPNPTNGMISVDLQLIEANDFTITVYNNTGQLMFQSTNNLSSGNNKLTFDLEKLPNGIYYLMVQGQKDQVSKRLIKR